MLEEGIVSLLLADSVLPGLLNSCVYPAILPESPSLPALTYQAISGSSSYTIDGVTCTMRRIQFDSWSTLYSDVKTVQYALHNVLDLFSGTLSEGTQVLGSYRGIEMDTYESDARMYRATTEYLFHFVE